MRRQSEIKKRLEDVTKFNAAMIVLYEESKDAQVFLDYMQSKREIETLNWVLEAKVTWRNAISEIEKAKRQKEMMRGK